MRILLVTLEYPPFKGGVANYYYNLAGHFPHQESFSVLDNNDKNLDSGKGFFSWRNAFAQISRKIRLSRIDYVLVGHLLPLGTVVWLLSYFKPFKYAVFLHGLDFASAIKTSRKKKLSQYILARADKIIAANSYVAAQVETIFPFVNGKVSIVNPGLAKNSVVVSGEEIENLKSKYNLSGKVVLLSLGRLVRRKGFDYIIKAMSKMSEEELKNVVYVALGRGADYEYLQSLITPNIIDKVIFLSEISDIDKWRWLHLCDIFIMPTRNIDGDYEGFGIVYLEANLCKKAVIAGDAGGVRDAVIDNVNGLLVDSESVDAIKDAILKLKNDKELRDKLGKQGRERAALDFNWDKLAVKLFNALNKN